MAAILIIVVVISEAPLERGNSRRITGLYSRKPSLWDDCQRGSPPIEVYTSDFKPEQELQATTGLFCLLPPGQAQFDPIAGIDPVDGAVC